MGVSVIFSPFWSYAVYVCSCGFDACGAGAVAGVGAGADAEGVTKSNSEFDDAGAAEEDWEEV